MKNISGIVKRIRDIMRQDVGTGSDASRIEQLGWMLFFKIICDKELEAEITKTNYQSPIPAELRWKKWADPEGKTGDELLDFIENELFPALQNLNPENNKKAAVIKEVFSNSHNYMKSGIHLRQVINELNSVDFNSSKDKQVFGQIYEGFLKELQSAGSLGEYYTPRAITELLVELSQPNLNDKILDPACGTGGFLTAALDYLEGKETKTGKDLRKVYQNIQGWEYKPLPTLLAITNMILHNLDSPNISLTDSLAKPLNDYRPKDEVDLILTNPPFGATVSNNNENNFPKNFRTKESADLFLVLILELLKTDGRVAIVLPDGSLNGDGVKQRIREKLLSECNLHTIIRLPNSVFSPYASVSTNLLFFERSEPTKNIWYWEHRLPEGYKAYSKTKPIQLSEFDELKKWWNNRKSNDQAWQVDIKQIIENNYNLDIKNPIQPEAEKQYNSSQLSDMLGNSFSKSNQLIRELGSSYNKS